MLRKISLVSLLILTVGVFGQVPTYVPKSGLDGYWSFSGNANDLSGNGNHGVVSGSKNSNGRNKQALSSYYFDGTNDYIKLKKPFFNGSTSVNKFTYFVIFKAHNSNGKISGKEGYWRTLSLQLSNSKLSWGGSQPSPNRYVRIESKSLIDTSEWYCAGVTFDGIALKLYLNDTLEVSSAQSKSSFDFSWLARGNSTSTNYFGAIEPVNTGITSYYKGYIDEFGTWSRVLSNQELSKLCAASKPCTTKYSTDTITSCGPYTWTDGKTYTTGNNTAKDTFTNAAGCDSVVTLNLTVISSQTDTVLIDQFTMTFRSAFSRNSISLSGDSSYLLKVTGRYGYADGFSHNDAAWNYRWGANNNKTICANGNIVPRKSIVWQSKNITNRRPINDVDNLTDYCSGNDKEYIWTLDNLSGAQNFSFVDGGGYGDNSGSLDFKIYVLRTRNPISYSTDTITSCGPYTWTDGKTYTTSNNTAKDTFTNTTGCDSIVTLNLTVNTKINTNGIGQVNKYSIKNDGIDDYAEFNLKQESKFTIMTWVKFNSWNSKGYNTIFQHKNNCVRGGGYNVGTQNDQVRLMVNNCGSCQPARCNTEHDLTNIYKLNLNEYYFFALTSDGKDEISLYINGKRVARIKNSNAIVTYGVQPLTLGRWLDGTTLSYSNTNHEDLSYWNYNLDSSEINSYMNCPPKGNESGLVGYWNFEDGNGSSVTDLTSNGNNGSLKGGVTWSNDLPSYNCTSIIYSDTITSCGPYTWTNGVTYTTDNTTARDTFISAAGCDSIVTLNLQIIDNDILPDDITLCDNRSIKLGEENTNFDTTGYIDAGSYNGYHYYFDQTLRSWTAARSRAINAGSDLAIIKDSSENAYIQSQISAVLPNTFQYIHLGLIQDTSAANYAEPAGGWYWLNGDSLTFKNWASSEPSNSATCTAGENYGIMWLSGKWNDVCPSQGGRGLVKVKNKFSSYLWSTGDTIPAITVNPDSSQTYWVEVSNGTFACRDSIYITVLPSSYDTLTFLECDSVISPTGKVYTSTGSYNDTLVNSYGCDSVITSLVTIGDTISPAVLTQNLTLYLNQMGQVSTSSSDVNNGSSDNCGIRSYRLSDSIFDCTDVGTNTIYLIVTDRYGNIDSASAVITVQDTIKPTVLTQNVTVSLDASGAGSVTAADIDNGSTDNCSIATSTLSKSSFDCSNVGANTIYLIVTDANGNIDSASAVITVQDTIKPTVLTQNVTVSLDANGAGTVTAADIDNGSTDNCSIATRTLSKSSFDCSEIGANTIYLIVTDVNGNIDSASAVITVQDTIRPTVFTQNVTVSLDASGAGSITVADIDNGSTDNCSIATRTLSKISFDCSNVGANTIYLIVTDVNGNIDSASAVITVQDTIKPTVLTQNVTVSLAASGAGTVTAADIDNGSTDNCSIATRTLSKSSFDCSEIGANTIYLIVTDVNGNIDSASAVITVQDTIKPTVLTQNVTVSLDASGAGSVTAADIDNGSTDNCSIATRTLSKMSFDCSNVGANTIYLIVTDVNGNIDSASAVITVQDAIKPTVLTQNVTVSLDANGAGSITVIDIDNGSIDNCGIASRSLSKSAFDCSEIGANTIYLFVRDVNGNIDSASAVITVQDTIKPTVINSPSDVALGYCDSAYTYTIPSVSDNCGVTITQIAGLPPGSIFPEGITVNTFEISDPSGNTVIKSFTVDMRARYMPFATSDKSICNNTNKIDLSKGFDNIIFFGDGVEDNEKFFNPNVLEPGSYSILAEFTDSMGCISTAKLVIEIRTSPFVPVLKRVASDQIVSLREYNNYQWYRNGEELEGENEQLLRVYELGIYALLVGNDENCFEISEGYGFGIPVNEENVTNQGLVKVFPNPTRDVVFVQINDKVDYHILTVVDAIGNLLIEQESSNKVVKLDVTSLAPGTYYLNVLGGSTNEDIIIVKK